VRPNLICTLTLLTGFAMAGSAGAQDEEAFAPASQAHRPGRWSMQFQLVEDFQFRAFDDAGLAMTRNAGANSAWRFGVTLNGTFLDRDLSTTVDSITSEHARPDDADRYSVRLDLLRLRRFHPARRVGLELGIGPSVNFERYRDEYEAYVPDLRQLESRASSSTYGLAGRLGVEVFLARALSVHAHYGALAGYQQTTTGWRATYSSAGRPTTVDDFEAQRRRWFLRTEGVTMGISVYL